VTRAQSRARRWVAIAALAAAVFCAAVVVIPVAERAGVTAASWARMALRPACHQIPERCLDLGAGPLPVCARCAGLYAGGLLGLLFTAVSGVRVRPRLRWIAVVAVPSVLDFGLGLLALPSLDNWPRFTLASGAGLLLGLLLADAIWSIANRPSKPSTDHLDHVE
jgi:uncharacterized membrane protein